MYILVNQVYTLMIVDTNKTHLICSYEMLWNVERYDGPQILKWLDFNRLVIHIIRDPRE